MSSNKCLNCDKRKGGRECPVVGGLICSRCCGENRGTTFNCPPDCRYFKKHERYQQEKEAENYRRLWAETIQQLAEEQKNPDKLFHTIATLETLIFHLYENEGETNLTNGSIIKGLEGLKKHLGTIEIPGSTARIEEFLWSNVEPLIERGYTSKKNLKQAINYLLKIAQKYSPEERDLVWGLIGRVREDYELPPEEPEEEGEGLIVTPQKIQRRMQRGQRTGGGLIEGA